MQYKCNTKLQNNSQRYIGEKALPIGVYDLWGNRHEVGITGSVYTVVYNVVKEWRFYSRGYAVQYASWACFFNEKANDYLKTCVNINKSKYIQINI